MIRNYFTVAVRNLLRQPVYSLINIPAESRERVEAGVTSGCIIVVWSIDDLDFHYRREELI